MQLTKRRLQFLHTLIEMYQKTNLPIHYEALAASLGVSKWTTYDMLKQIEKLGLISRGYKANRKETGRSQVVFSPTPKAFDLFRQPEQDTLDDVDWKKTVRRVFTLLRQLKPQTFNDSVRKMIVELRNMKDEMNYCAYMIGLLLMYVKKFGGSGCEALIRRVMDKAPTRESGLAMLAGTMFGMAMPKMNEELGEEMAHLVSRFLRSVETLTHGEKEKLASLFAEGIG